MTRETCWNVQPQAPISETQIQRVWGGSWNSHIWDTMVGQVEAVCGQTLRTAGLETPATFSYQCHSTLVTYLERMGIFFPDARHKHVGLNKPVSALVRRLVGRGIHCPPLPASLGSHSVDWIESVCSTKPKGRESLSIQLIFVIPSIWCLKRKALWEMSLFLAKGNA